MDSGGDPARDNVSGEWLRAFSVHVFTASGAALALLALIAAVHANWPLMFLWLGIALVVDGVDGILARHTNVNDLAPRWSGDVLDLVVDFTTYVFVPAYAIYAAGLMPAFFAVVLSLAIVVSSAVYFADREMKTDDNSFRGFPCLWNVVAFYLLLLRPPGWFAVLVIVGFIALTFAPIRFVHPIRVAERRNLHIVLIAAWALLALIVLVSGFEPGAVVKLALLAIGLYFLGASLLRWQE